MAGRSRSTLGRFLAIVLLLLGGAGYGANRLGLFTRVEPDVVTLVRVSDGDTVVVQDSGGRQIKVRLVGVDAPELGTSASFRSALFSAELCEKAREIRLEPEPTKPTDKYGRVLAWVWLTMPDGKRRLLNHELIHSGNAEMFQPTSRNVKYYDKLR
jgi:micrococcal nuclease